METIIRINTYIFAIVCAIVTFNGLDLKKWTSWLYGAYGFTSGFLVGLQWANLNIALQGGALLGFIILFGGAMSRWQRRRFSLSEKEINKIQKKIYKEQADKPTKPKEK